jgi:hypothetical protein
MHTTCKKCQTPLEPGQAIQQTWGGIPDFMGSTEVCTVSPGGPGKLIDCLKCPACGWSMTIPEESERTKLIHRLCDEVEGDLQKRTGHKH